MVSLFLVFKTDTIQQVHISFMSWLKAMCCVKCELGMQLIYAMDIALGCFSMRIAYESLESFYLLRKFRIVWDLTYFPFCAIYYMIEVIPSTYHAIVICLYAACYC